MKTFLGKKLAFRRLVAEFDNATLDKKINGHLSCEQKDIWSSVNFTISVAEKDISDKRSADIICNTHGNACGFILLMDSGIIIVTPYTSGGHVSSYEGKTQFFIYGRGKTIRCNPDEIIPKYNLYRRSFGFDITEALELAIGHSSDFDHFHISA